VVGNPGFWGLERRMAGGSLVELVTLSSTNMKNFSAATGGRHLGPLQFISVVGKTPGKGISVSASQRPHGG
jgi:hypothetical protein